MITSVSQNEWDEYNLTFGKDENDNSRVLINYHYRSNGHNTSIISKEGSDLIEACKGLMKLLDAKELNITIKSRL